MSASDNTAEKLKKQLLALESELEALREKNSELEERLKAYSVINSGQLSLIKKLIDRVPFGVMLLDENDYITHSNVAAEKIFDIPVSEMKGQLSSQFFLDDAQLNTASVFENKDEDNQQRIYCSHNGKYILHSSFISDEGSQNITVATFIDITKIKQAEQEQIKASKIKDEFLGMISHELRTPLNVIQGYSSLLEEKLSELKDTDASGYIQNINIAGEMLLNIVNNLIELSDLTAGKIKVDNIPVDLDMIVTQLNYRLEKLFKDKNNKLIIQYDDIKPFEQDLALLMKVLYELLLNANKFTDNGDISLFVSLQKKDDREWLCFSIKDTGCGMTDATIEKIFHAFAQADSSLTRSYEGLGLGLTLVEKSTYLIKGFIEVESEFGVGSHFSVYVPYYPVAN